VTEDFEGFTSFEMCQGVVGCTYDTAGATAGTGLQTAVGEFRTILPAGTGTTNVAPTDRAIVRSGTESYSVGGRFDADPDTGLDNNNYLDSNDNSGIKLIIPGATNLGMFDRVAMLLTDVDDVGRAKFSVVASGAEFTENTFANPTVFGNGKLFLLTFLFDAPVNSATIAMNIDPGDGFGVDYVGVGVVPLPAPALLLIGGLAGLAAFRRKRAAA
jgi:hypothetical protein